MTSIIAPFPGLERDFYGTTTSCTSANVAMASASTLLITICHYLHSNKVIESKYGSKRKYGLDSTSPL